MVKIRNFSFGKVVYADESYYDHSLIDCIYRSRDSIFPKEKIGITYLTENPLTSHYFNIAMNERYNHSCDELLDKTCNIPLTKEVEDELSKIIAVLDHCSCILNIMVYADKERKFKRELKSILLSQNEPYYFVLDFPSYGNWIEELLDELEGEEK